MMRRVMLLAAAMAFALAVAGGAALADNIEGDGGNDRLVGTNGKDTISGAGGNDDIFGKGGSDRLFGDSGNDDVYGGGKSDTLQGGLGQDELFGQQGSDFANALDGQANDRVNCGRGFDVAAIDDFEIAFGEPGAPADQVSQNCELLYVGVVIFDGPAAASSVDLSAIDTREEAEAAEADGLLKQVR
jgi:hemolysin type calcium-binding protein